MKTKTQQIKLTCVAAALLVFGVQSQAQSFTEVVQNALAIYPSMLAAKAKTDAQRSDIDRARAAHMPQISYGYARSKYANTELPASIHPNTCSPSVRLNLWSGGRIEADAERAEALTQSSEYQEALTRDDVALQAAEAYINWARALDMFELASKNLESHRVTRCWWSSCRPSAVTKPWRLCKVPPSVGFGARCGASAISMWNQWWRPSWPTSSRWRVCSSP
jgi:hypothetical protein